MSEHRLTSFGRRISNFFEMELLPGSRVSIDVTGIPRPEIYGALGIDLRPQKVMIDGDTTIIPTMRADTFLEIIRLDGVIKIESFHIVRVGSEQLPYYRGQHGI